MQILNYPLLFLTYQQYRTWRESRPLRGLIPVCCNLMSAYSIYIPSVKVLTTSIVLGWLLSVSTLGQWSHLGYVKGSVGGTYLPVKISALLIHSQSQLSMH